METKQKECEICGVWFTPSRSSQKYCPECGKDSTKAWRDLHTAAKPVKLQTGYKIPSAPAAENQCLRRMTKETPGGTTGTAPRNAGKNT